MSGNVSNLPDLGKTFFDLETPPTPGQTLNIEGTVVTLRPKNARPASGAGTHRHGAMWKCRLTRNDSGGALAAKAVVSWKANFRGRRVDGVTGSAEEEIAGIVDPLLTHAVADDDLFWLIQEGESVPAAKSTGAAWTEGNPLVCTNDGKLAEIATPTGIDVLNICGRVHDDASSAATTGLVDLRIN